MKYLIIFLLFTISAFSQTSDKSLPQGNSSYQRGEFVEAEAKYRIAHSNKPLNSTASYNLGNAMYRQGRIGEAMYAYAKAAELAKTKQEKHKAWHNIGNGYMMAKEYSQAVEAYKNALRNNPYDEQTRYNYALARRKQRENPPPPPPFESKEREKNQNRRESDKDTKSPQPDGKGNEKDTAGNNGDRKKEENKQGNDKQGKTGTGNRDETPASKAPSEQRIKNMLDAINNEERKIMDRVNSRNSKGDPVKHEKDW